MEKHAKHQLAVEDKIVSLRKNSEKAVVKVAELEAQIKEKNEYLLGNEIY